MTLTQKGMQKLLDKFQNEDTWLALGEGLLKIMAILIITNILIRIGKLMIHNIFKIRNLSPLSTSERREETLSRLLDNVLSYVVYFIAFMMILSVLGIDVKALIAGAGVVGLAVGFGAQSLVKDVISGFFIIFEDQFSVGDHVRIGQFEGNVEAIGLRTTKVKSWTGELHILPNGSIIEVTNFSINNSIAVVDIAIAYGEDIAKAEKVIEEAIQFMPAQYEELVKPPELLGIQTMGATEIVLRVVAETLPMKQAGVSRMIRRDIKLQLDENGIKAPDPKVVMYGSGQPK
ncbi:mechanosensitive ion channel family protein [Neobacillus sp. MER 74]|uniref:mechanosensitive ion channel family protein n=1 Tax=Neobacillus sp. MER 74 TaxID=2939566 RepID=UPI00203D3AA2|nr:mechanosensitive ion channel family protein [Neobacillus sp. MER 74]MCM3118136.1 mechanosensitive ion channel family protein [Neobacillus sp. MER 74]